MNPVVFLDSPVEAQITNRRRVFFGSVAALTLAGTIVFALSLLTGDVHPLWILLLVPLFTLLFGSLAFGFCQAVIGWMLLARGGDPFRITTTLREADHGKRSSSRTAILVPIFNEDVNDVFSRIRVMRRSIKAIGCGSHFDFYVLSDSTDPNKWIEEEMAWAMSQSDEMKSAPAVYYRRRKRPINQKSGNVADFCRRWGSHYRYMVVLDADSFVSAGTIAKLVKLMEANPAVGIIQTVPRIAGASTMFARAQQFCSRLFSPLFAAGANYWQQGDANYWGHNAIIRVAPFMKHCALPHLPGTGPFSGRILSHDFIEAALMRKAGWEVWTAYDLPGTYEGAPPNLLEYLKRDRRWCQGNMQHFTVMLAQGIPPLARVHLAMGILSYLLSPLLAIFLLAGVAASLFTGNAAPLPLAMPLLLAATAVMIFGWQLLALGSTLASNFLPRAYGGRVNVVTSVLTATLLSTLLAPVFIWHHTRFVVLTLLNRKVTWKTQNRNADVGTSWSDAVDEHGLQTIAGVVAIMFFSIFAPQLALWYSPLLLGCLLSIPLSVLASRPIRDLTKAHLFRVPEELDRSGALAHLHRALEDQRNPAPGTRSVRADRALARAALDPVAHAVHTSMLRKRHFNPELISVRERLFRRGATVLSLAEKQQILSDADSLKWLHRRLWSTPARALPDWWKMVRHDVLSSPMRYT